MLPNFPADMCLLSAFHVIHVRYLKYSQIKDFFRIISVKFRIRKLLFWSKSPSRDSTQ